MSFFNITANDLDPWILGITFIFATLTSVYTAFLLAQAKGRDFWQSPLLPFEKLALSLALGSTTLLLAHHFLGNLDQKFLLQTESYDLISMIFLFSVLIVLLISLMEVIITHSTADAQTVAHSFKTGSWKLDYWGGLLLGTIIPMVYLLTNEFIS